ncbi:unnamed protein product [Prorocentrum cordatum]|uniref:ABC transporter domain-containing protein n=1 Tax=Prorocentrum cordatum TaxID=2364126 RepID=A0ABN9VU07_9DINO|nr:unnamed protein product [Polarella glacialis]
MRAARATSGPNRTQLHHGRSRPCPSGPGLRGAMGLHVDAPRPPWPVALPAVAALLLAARLPAVATAGAVVAERRAVERGVLDDSTQFVQTHATREGGDGDGGGGGLGASALLSWLGPALLGKISPDEVAELEKMVSGSQNLGAEALKQLQGDVKVKHPKAYAAILSALHMSDEEVSQAVPSLPEGALALGRVSVEEEKLEDDAPAPPKGHDAQGLRLLLVAATVLLVAVAGLVSCLTGFWDGGAATAAGEQPPTSSSRRLARQLAALSWKNAKVTWRAELPMCSSCCNGCCCMLAPVIFIGMLTVLPSFVMKVTGASKMLLVEHPVEYGRNYSDASAWHHAGLSLRDHLFMEPKDEGADTGWRSMLQDPITTPWHPMGLLPQGACYCRTLGAVGPGAAKFIDYSKRTYQEWSNHQLSQDERWKQAVKLARGDMRRQLRMLFGVQEQECPAHDKATFFREFGSVAEAERLLGRYNYGTVSRSRSPDEDMDRLCGVIVFDNDPTTADVPRYTIRTNVTGLDATGSVAQRVVAEQQRGMQKQALGWYQQSGFLSMQELVQDFVAEIRLGPKQRGPGAVFVPLPADSYKLDKLQQTLAVTVASTEVCTATFSAVVVLAAYLAIRERNSKQKELMRLMGLGDGSLALSWLLLYAFQNALVSLGCSLLVQSALVNSSEFVILFLIFFLTAMASTLVGLTVSALISTERLGALVAFGAYQCMGLMCHGLVKDIRQTSMSSDGSPQAGADATSAASAHLLIASFLPNVAFVLVLKAFFALETNFQGCTWQSVHRRVHNYTVASGLTMLFVDVVVWGLAYAYLDQVISHDVGATRPYNFPFTRSFWREVFGLDDCGGAPPQRGDDAADAELGQAPHHPDADPELFEEEGSARLQELRGRGHVVSVRGLQKVFVDAAGRTVRAVDDLSLTMYRGECFCLLGHNGAGKTTTMACLTGMLQPTAGDVRVLGRRMPAELQAIRQDMSFCMQQNVLWDSLTVEEHTQLFGALMGLSQRLIRAASGRALAQVELLHKRHAQACQLSGGMKRKLSVALALLGDSKVVVLDEPTAGMDPHTRRQLWAVLKQSRTERILCLTTHHMDEADEIGDRVCIMVQGRAACSGTNAFLKQRLGCGYLLTFVKAGEAVPDRPIVSLVAAHCGEGVQTAASAGRELRVQVPFAGASAFPALMRELDRRLQELGAESYGVGVSDLEDVFLKVANGEAARPGARAVPAALPAAPAAPSASHKVETGHAGHDVPFKRQFIGLFQRRVRYGRRDSRTFCCQLVMPIVIMVVFLTISKVGMSHMGRYPHVRVDLAGWDGGRPALVSVGLPPGSERDQRSQSMALSWQMSPGLGEACDVRVNKSLHPASVQGNFKNKQRNKEEMAFADYAFGLRHDGSGNSQLGGIMYAEDRVTFFPNTSAHFAGPALLELHFRAMVEAEGARPLHLEVSSQPLPATGQERGVIAGIGGFAMGMVVFTAYSFIATGIAAYVTMEKELEVKQQLMISGASPLAYWASNLGFDCVFGLFAFVGTMLVMAIFGAREWCSFPNIGATMTLLTLFTPAVSLFAYFWSHFFNTSGSALIGVLMLGLFLGTFGINISETLSLFPQTRAYGQGALMIIEGMLPSACVGHGLMKLAMYRDISKAMDVSPFAGYLTGTEFCSPVRGSLPCVVNAGDDCIMLLVDVILYAGLIYSSGQWESC